MEWESNLCHEKQQIGHRNGTSDGYMQQKTPITECIVFMDGLQSRVKDYKHNSMG